ncbi:Uncharacterised protein [uncultured archaeon]|nr:Uncharacterised protein [uncultured archaeon]
MEITKTPELVNRLSSEPELKVIDDSDAALYLDRLNTRLGHLSQILTLEGNEGGEFVIPYIEVVKNSIEALKLKYQLQGQDRVDFALTIACRNSGFPTEKDLYMLERNKSESGEVLNCLPSRDGIVNSIRNAILRNDSVVNSQTLLKRFNFYSMIDKTNLLNEFHLNEPKLAKEQNGRRMYTLEWSCIERTSKVPVLYRMYLTQNKRFEPLEEKSNKQLETIIYQTHFGFFDIGAFARHIDNEIEEVHPKLLEKYTIGPFYNSLTENSPEMNQLLYGVEEPSVLKFTIERVMSERVRQYGGNTLFDRLINIISKKKTEREVFGPVDSETKMIVPFRLKQELGNNDEYGNSCRVYGITKGGDIV